jgi:hypothetical protein
LTKKYFKGRFEKDLNILSTFQATFSDTPLDELDRLQFQKMQSIFFIGQLVGLPTLQSILTKFGIQSNSLQIRYTKLCNRLSINKIRKMFEYIFEQQISEQLVSMNEKDSSIWSKNLVTLVLDDSIFKQWLKKKCEDIGFEDYFGCFFSGQYKAAVYGFKVLTLALSIDGVLYPLYFEFVKKKPKNSSNSKKGAKSADTEPEAIKSAIKLLNKWGEFSANLAQKGTHLPILHLSCDSGYSHKKLAEVCSQKQLTYISVPKKSHCFAFTEGKIKLATWIDTVFLEAEKKHQQKEKDLPTEEKTTFVLRQRAKYLSQDQEVTLLAFRLQGSEKVSVIYSTNKSIFAKTLRRHWFQRTYIEQFFKILKHVLQISQARVGTKDKFENKLLTFAFIALQAQKLVRFLRRRIKDFAHKGFISLQRILNSESEFLDLLQNYT